MAFHPRNHWGGEISYGVYINDRGYRRAGASRARYPSYVTAYGSDYPCYIMFSLFITLQLVEMYVIFHSIHNVFDYESNRL
jgi:hypothetical protein